MLNTQCSTPLISFLLNASPPYPQILITSLPFEVGVATNPLITSIIDSGVQFITIQIGNLPDATTLQNMVSDAGNYHVSVQC
jgi:hypothetical protein